MNHCRSLRRSVTTRTNFDSMKKSLKNDMLMNSLTNIVNKEAVPTPGVYKNRSIHANYELKSGKSNLWDASQVGIIIRNEVYIGTLIGRKLSTVRP